MSPDPLRLDALLESVADGADVDWAAAEAAADDRQRRLIKNLRVVANIAQVHRTVPDETPADGATLFETARTRQEVPRWGHLLLLETIGEGTFGEVYRARDPWLDREVALKLLKPGIAGPERLVAEARALARVRHPNVVTVHGADMHHGRVGLWMELVRGRTLAHIVESDGPFSAAEAVIIGQELCKAVAAVHAVGLVHRDIKAQNVMRESGGRLVLMDFGAGHTPLYLAPELIDGGPPTVASDIYALGVLLYYLVVGKYPVVGASLDELKHAHARGERTQLAEARHSLPDAFTAVVERALSPEPAQRFSSVREMDDALARQSSSFSARSTFVRPARPTGVRQWAAVAAAAVAVAIAGLVGWRVVAPRFAPRSDTPLLAVLPLLGEGGAPDYFADGLTEAVMQELAGINGLSVVSRTSVDHARRMEKTLPSIARALNADAILEGSVSKGGQRVRASVRLIHAGSDTAVWARTFDEPLDQVFDLQRRLARAVADALAVRVPSPQPTTAAVHPDAYEAYLRGRYRLRAASLPATQEALRSFERAIAVDPSFARAHAGLADCYLYLGDDFAVMPPAQAFALARMAVGRAMALDRQLADAYVTSARLKFEADWSFGASEQDFRRALELDPSLVEARQRYAMFLASRGRLDEAMRQVDQARRVDPLSPSVAVSAGAVLYYARRFDEAIVEFERALSLEPLRTARFGLGRAHAAKGAYEQAIRSFRLAADGSAADLFVDAELAQIDAARGRVEDARVVLERFLRATQDNVSVPPHLFALVYARLGDRDQAFSWLRKAFDARSGRVLWLMVDPRFDPLRSDARFVALRAELERPR